jgi:sulfur-oxidizing protein SoxA
MSAATRTLQEDDAQNPGFLWVQDGRQRFARDCAACHGADTLRGAAARYPALDRASGKPITLAGRIRQCHASRAQQGELPWESETLLALESYVAHLSRGTPIAPPRDERLDALVTQGERLWRQPFGQIGLACTQCHDALAGKRLAGSTIPQAHPTGYPIYRLEWQGLGSLQRRLRGCMSGVRAEPFAYGADEWLALEVFLMRRAAGMLIESPGVRP